MIGTEIITIIEEVSRASTLSGRILDMMHSRTCIIHVTVARMKRLKETPNSEKQIESIQSHAAFS